MQKLRSKSVLCCSEPSEQERVVGRGLEREGRDGAKGWRSLQAIVRTLNFLLS